MKSIQSTLDLIAKYKSNIKPTKFQLAEEAGRKLFIPFCFKNKMVPQFNEDLAGAYDAFSGDRDFYELKYKQGHHFKGNKYENLISKEGLMLEHKKYNGLKELWLKDKSKNYYYWMAYEDKTFIHQIDFNKEYKSLTKSLPNSTVEYSKMEDKSYYLIPLKNCTITDTIK